MDENKQTEDKSSWKSRNKELKRIKSSGGSSWQHLIIGQNKETKKKFLRLYKYYNWFSIPTKKDLLLTFKQLLKGANELNWKLDETKFGFDDNLNAISAEAFVKERPNSAKNIINQSTKVSVYASTESSKKIIKTIENVNKQTSERFKLAFTETIEKLADQPTDGLQKLSDLMSNWDLLQITQASALVKSRLDTIEVFEKMMHDPNTYEINTDKSIHRLLEKNMWLIDERYWVILSNKSLRKFVGDEILRKDKAHSRKRPDFACVETISNKLIIIEIKKPSVELKKGELDQAELYHRLIKKYKGKKYTGIEVTLVGNKISNEATEIESLRKGTKVRTYNDFLQDVKKRYKDYLDIIEKATE